MHDPASSPSTAACAECPYKNAQKICMAPGGRHPEACPTVNQEAVLAAALAEYAKPDIAAFACRASIQEGAGYAERESGYAAVRPLKPRILEIAEFARRMGYSRLGLIFCAGLALEGRRAAEFYREKGFAVVSAICKVGQVPKETIGVKDEEKIAAGRHESICNPIAQAMLMNAAKTQLNVLVGLCVGHDSLVFKYSEAPCTVLAAKDRVFGHNPLAAVYTLDSYYRYLKQPLE
ncbi:MAG: DUF1847 domain-containing protein [Desulfobacterales bacterium]|jgi:uncharacterized metal-binding protein|nr:DUF1847 domain-containing protein [Desulfobacterales bacterium]